MHTFDGGIDYLHFLCRVTKDTCILFFSRTATAEAEHKTFGERLTKRQNARIAAALIKHTQATIAASGFPCMHYDETMQSGTDFGQKLVQATRSVFEQGYQHVIIVGNDCPELSTQLLLDAQAHLRAGQQVVAPTPTGGLYLIGVSKETFDIGQFLACEWETERCFSTFAAASTHVYSILQSAADVSEIRSYLSGATVQLRRLVSAIIGFSLAEYCSSAYRNIVDPPRSFSAAHPFRGPPLSVLFAG